MNGHTDTFGYGSALTEIVDEVIAKARAAVDLGLPLDGLANPTLVLGKLRALQPVVPTLRGEDAA